MKPDRVLRLLTIIAAALFGLVVMVIVVIALASPLGALAVLVAAALSYLAWRLVMRRVRAGTTLEIDLDRGVVESPPSTPLERTLRRGAVVLRDVIDALDRAAGDDRITGVVVRLGNGRLGLAQAQEIREGVARFRATGKRAVAYAETFGESGRAIIDYYLAAAFSEIHLQPMGSLSVEGTVTRTPFLRSLFDRLGVVPDLDHRRQYKAAKYLLTETGYVDPHREAAQAILEDQMRQIVEGIASDRGLEPARVREMVDDAPLLDAQALDAGLVDDLSYRDQAYRAAGAEAGRLLYHDRYLKRAGRPHRRGTRIALVYGTGAIARGGSRFDPLTGSTTLGADEVAQTLREAAADDKVKGIVFRVDSPGGSAVASEVVRREVARAREAGKAVVVSMGDVAGSGGYWISTPAQRIVAQPGTITASIGVVGGKLAAAEAWSRVGIDWGELHEGRNATFSVALRPYTDTERARLEAQLDSIYDEFKDRVAKARSMDPEAVEEVAKGRVWTGAQAKERGLVDELGGMHRAIEIVRDLAGIPEKESLQIKVFPARRPLPLPERKEGSDPVFVVAEALSALVRSLQEVADRPAVELTMTRRS